MSLLSRTSRRCVSISKPILRPALTTSPRRNATTSAQEGKREGDISDAFASLSGIEWKPLEPRFADVKKQLMTGHEEALEASWIRLLNELRTEVQTIAALGPKVVPEIDFRDLDAPTKHFSSELRKRGVAIVRNALPEAEALALKEDLKSYIKANPQTKAFPQDNPQVYELYWSLAQMKGRLHPNMLKTYRFLMSYWHSKDPSAPVSVEHPTAYADRLRMRVPGDNKFALGPHVDGGSCERWEDAGYGLGRVYDDIFKGKWEDHDSWEISCRLPVVSDLYGGVGACSVFRAHQGWLSMSETGPFEGTLLVNPLLKHATAYYLLRPFFSPVRTQEPPIAASKTEALHQTDDFLRPENWRLNRNPDSWLHGATPGHGQELRDHLHPHLKLDQTMVHIGTVRPGDYVSWHCDTIHSVDFVHKGASDSSVMYIPACPLTALNADHLRRQRDNFVRGVPSPDFPGGVGESEHVGRVTAGDLEAWAARGHGFDVESLRAFGMEPFDSTAAGLTSGQRRVMDQANKRLGYYV